MRERVKKLLPFASLIVLFVFLCLASPYFLRAGNLSSVIRHTTVITIMAWRRTFDEEYYTPVDVTPWETASGGKAVECHNPAGCTLSTKIDKPAGLYDIAVQYFDIWRGVSHYELLVNERSAAHWLADDVLPPAQFDPHLDGQDSTRFTAEGVALKPGDTLTLRGIPDLRPELVQSRIETPAPGALGPAASQPRDYREYAPVDYIELGPNGPVTPQ